MQRHGVGDDGGDLGEQTGDGRHHEAGRALAVDHRLDRDRRPCARARCPRPGGGRRGPPGRGSTGWGGRSRLARQFSSQTSKPSATRTSTRLAATGARKMLARTPAPWTSSTGPRRGATDGRRTWIKFRVWPSPVVNSTTTSLSPHGSCQHLIYLVCSNPESLPPQALSPHRRSRTGSAGIPARSRCLAASGKRRSGRTARWPGPRSHLPPLARRGGGRQ